MIHSADKMNEETQWHLKNTLERVRTNERQVFGKQSIATGYLLLAELAGVNYHLVFGSSVHLVTDVFAELQV